MSCNLCNSPSCNGGCNPAGHLVPQPFYVKGKPCVQSHTQQVIVNQYALGLEVSSSWNIPTCGASASLSVPGVTTAPVGAYIWNASYGYFQIVGFDPIGQTLSVQNPCYTDNLTPGSQVPSCTVFTISPPPCCSDVGQSGGIYLKYDFTAPADGDCIDITLTSQVGLSVNNEVEIGSGIYGLSAVKANNVVTICNNGLGIAAGTPVIAQNSSGLYQYPVGTIYTNPCSSSSVLSAKVIGCVGTGQNILAGAQVNAPLILSNIDGTASYDFGYTRNIQNSTYIWGGVSSGSANAQVLSMNPPIVGYVPGQTFLFQAGYTNTSAVTININGLGVRNIQNNDGSIYAGNILAGGVYAITYTLAGVFRLVNTEPAQNNTWTPTIGVIGGGGVSAVTIYIASYKVTGKWVDAILSFKATLAANTSSVSFTLPLNADTPFYTTLKQVIPVSNYETYIITGAFFNANTIEMGRNDTVDFATGVEEFHLSFNYFTP
jgi:hypothetical protein